MSDTYMLGDQEVSSVELKCMVVSRGLNIDRQVYIKLGKYYRIYPNALCCNSFILPDGTIVMATDLSFHMSTLSSMFSWDNIKLLRYIRDMKTDFKIVLEGNKPVLTYKSEPVCEIRFFPATDFYKQKASSDMPFLGNAVLQGSDWVSFQCLWPCEYAQAGKSCQYCFSGGQYEALAKREKPMPFTPSPWDVSDVTNYAIKHDDVNSIQITGGSTFDQRTEEKHIRTYLGQLNESGALDALTGEKLLYVTPPKENSVVDDYFSLGASRVACSLEVWDDDLEKTITPGKYEFTTKKRQLSVLSYIAEKFGKGKAFSNFIIGLEPFESLKKGATYLAQRGIIPSASVWMPFGKPVMGSVKAPGLYFYKKVIDMLAELYIKYGLSPAGGKGLNVCIEKDIYNMAVN